MVSDRSTHIGLIADKTYGPGMQADTTLPIQESSESQPCGEYVSSPLGRKHAPAVPVGGQYPSAIQKLLCGTYIILLCAGDTLLLGLNIVDMICRAI